MSTYFAALMRASGLVPADQSPQYAIEHTPATRAIEDDAVAVTEPAAVVISPADSRVEQARLQSQPPDRERAAQSARAQTRAPRLPRDNADAPIPPQTAAPVPPESVATQSASPTPELHVRAAVQWVRADPHVLANAEGAVARSSVVDRPVPSKAARAVTLETAPTRPSPLQSRATVVDASIPAVSHRHRPPAQENIEVSIGAIHLRIDGSPASTAVNAPAPAQGSKPTLGAAHALPRSGLARRALRRI